MPPWPADASYTHFSDEKLLTDAEINLIGDWVKAGCPYGDSSLLPPAPVFENASQLGKPDLVLKMERPLFIKGDHNHFLFNKIAYQIPRDTFIRAINYFRATTNCCIT